MNRTPPIFPTVLCLSLTLPLAASLATPATAQEILDRASGATVYQTFTKSEIGRAIAIESLPSLIDKL